VELRISIKEERLRKRYAARRNMDLVLILFASLLHLKSTAP